MKKILLLLLTLLFIGCQDSGNNRPLLTKSKKKQPIYIVNPNRHLNIAEFWITQLENPDKVIMNINDIKKFNNDIAYKQGLYTNFKDINKFYSSKEIKEKILKSFNGIKGRVKYFSDNASIPYKFYKDIKKELNLKA